MLITCCKKCLLRHPACWDNCPEYQEEKKKAEMIKSKARLDKELYKYACDKKMNKTARKIKNQ